MRACATVNVLAGTAMLAALSFAACGGNPTPPATPASEKPAETAAPGETPSESSAASDAEEPGADQPASEEQGGSEEKGDTETRTTELIQKIIQDNRKPIRECFDKARKELPDLAGTMTIHFVLDPEGKMKSAELNVERSEVKAPAVVNCAIEHLKKIKFPPSSRGMESSVNYPFSFK